MVLKESAEAQTPVPKVFVAFIGGYTGRSYRLTLKDGALDHTSMDSGFSNPKTEKLTPTVDQWERFRRGLEDAGVWGWQRSYTNRDVRDGTSWQLRIRWGKRSVETGGSNAQPEGFSVFLEAIKELTGGMDFQ